MANCEVHDEQAGKEVNMEGKSEPMDHVVSQDPKSDPKETIIFAKRHTDEVVKTLS